jgi:hypothetical protein
MYIEDHDPLDRLQEAAKEYRNTRTWPRVRAIILGLLLSSALLLTPRRLSSRSTTPSRAGTSPP